MQDSNYPTSQALLYIVLRLMWQDCLTRIAQFATLKPKYTTTYVEGKLAAIDAAEELPDEEAIALTHSTLRKDLITLGKDGCYKWQALKLYIEDAFEGDYIKINLDAAGWQLYDKASNKDWPALNSMMKKGSEYIAAHLAELTANDNMPTTFEEEFNDEKDAIKLKTEAFGHAETTAPIATAAKITSNNNCYDDGISMGADGQHLYQADEEVAKLFSFNAVSERMKPNGAPTLILTIESDTDQPLANADGSIIGTDKTGVSDGEGRIPFTQMTSGTGRAKIVADGYQEQFVDYTLTAGTTTRITVTMVPLFTGEMTVGSEPVTTPTENVNG